MNKYTVKGKIGQGAHGVVMKAVNVRNGQEVAVKRICYKRPSKMIPMHVFREIFCLKHVDHRFVVELLDVFQHSLGCVLIFDYMPSGLAEMIEDAELTVTEAEIKSYMLMLLSGIAHIHRLGIIHRDLKPANLLIDKEGLLKIADFGLGRIYNQNEDVICSHQVATRWYRAPELLYSSRNYNEGIDLWAIGCIFAELIKRTPLFPGDNDIEQLAIVLRTLGTPTEETWPGLQELPDYNKITFPFYKGMSFSKLFPDSCPEIINLIGRFLNYDSSKRPSALEAMSDKYFYIQPLHCPLSKMPKPGLDQKRKMEKESRYNLIEASNMSDLFEDILDLVTSDSTSSESAKTKEMKSSCKRVPFLPDIDKIPLRRNGEVNTVH